MRFSAAPEYQVFPTRERPLKPYEAAVKASAVTRELIRSFDPEVVVADILTVAAALAAELEGRPWATLVPHVMPAGEPRLPRLRGGRPLPAHAARAGGCGSSPARCSCEERSRDGASSTERGHAWASRRWPTCTEASRASSLSWPPSPSSSTRARRRPPAHAHHRPAAVGAALRRRRPAAGRRSARAGGAEHLPGPRGPAAAGRPRRAWPPSPYGSWPPPTGVPRPARSRRRPTRAWWTGSRTRRPCRTATRWSATPATARSPGRSPAVCRWWPARTPATWPRTRRASAGPGLGVSLPRRFQTARGVRLAVRRLLADPGYAERAGELERWAAGHDGAAAAADAVEELAAVRERYPHGVH